MDCSFFTFIKFMIKVVQYLVYQSYYIALCAAGMVMMNMHQLSLAIFDYPYIPIFIFCSTLLAYRFHYIYKQRKQIPDVRFSQQKETITINNIINIVLIIIAAITFSYFNLLQMILMVSIMILTALYSYPLLPITYFKRTKVKSYGFLKPFYLALVWTLCTVLLPMLTVGALLSFLPIFSTYLFMLSLCILFDLKDITTDHSENIITIPQQLSRKALNSIIICIILVNCLFFLQQINAWTVALLMTSLIQIWITYDMIYNKSDHSFLYLLRVDGLMLIWSIFYLILKFKHFGN